MTGNNKLNNKTLGKSGAIHFSQVLKLQPSKIINELVKTWSAFKNDNNPPLHDFLLGGSQPTVACHVTIHKLKTIDLQLHFYNFLLLLIYFQFCSLWLWSGIPLLLPVEHVTLTTTDPRICKFLLMRVVTTQRNPDFDLFLMEFGIT